MERWGREGRGRDGREREGLGVGEGGQGERGVGCWGGRGRWRLRARGVQAIEIVYSLAGSLAILLAGNMYTLNQ